MLYKQTTIHDRIEQTAIPDNITMFHSAPTSLTVSLHAVHHFFAVPTPDGRVVNPKWLYSTLMLLPRPTGQGLVMCALVTVPRAGPPP
jgi:hypothetical protein